ncbi:AraC family ligand binding domain-containing protein (plasmid) [Pantoea piersonii]|uniref:AraC family ligand binding domain-containing protein n=1 Tax=Pantoea piersonii TaxID=2364647 RepID=A0AAJ5UBY0_9GAMM|nr:AraC family ligand binding domain-containing protein [Pantoea piersonii]WBG92888.1 AraC family ligand binding domain-containing protein [Pantoea piersonii]
MLSGYTEKGSKPIGEKTVSKWFDKTLIINHKSCIRSDKLSLQSAEWFSRNGIECSRIQARNSGFPKHLHDEQVISANLTGSEEIWLSGKNTYVKSGQVTLYNPGTIQASRFDNQPVEFISVHMPQSVMKMLADEENVRGDREAPILREGIINHAHLFDALYPFASTVLEGIAQGTYCQLMKYDLFSCFMATN